MRPFPSYRQLDAADCGPSCLRMILSFWGREVPLLRLRDACHIDRDGVSLQGIADAAKAEGLDATGVTCSFDELINSVPKPCIVHWKGNHFIVVYDIVNKHGTVIVRTADPAVGLVDRKEKEFLNGWLTDQGDGVAMYFEKTPAFYKQKNEGISSETGNKSAPELVRRSGLRYIFHYLRAYWRELVKIFICLVIASLISIAFPFISQFVVDRGIGTRSVHIVVAFLCAQIFLTLGSLVNNIIQGRLSLYMTTQMGITMISDFIGKLMRLPLGFFESRRLGDIMQRIGDHSRIQRFLTNHLMSMVVAIVSFVIYGIVMGYYNWIILLVFLAGSAIYIGWSILFLRRRRKLDLLRFQEASANEGVLVQLIQGMADIKLNGCEDRRRKEWEDIQQRLYKVSLSQLSLAQTQISGGGFIDSIKNALISFFAAVAVINGDMTLGMMTAVQFIVGQLNVPVSQFVSFLQVTQDASISMERLGEIHGMNDEETRHIMASGVVPASGDIALEHVSYTYPGSSVKALDDISLQIPTGKVTAVVGASGSGKTTMVKLMLGFFRPQSGIVAYNGKPLTDYSLRALRSRCGTVMQESFIFNGTIAMNIALTDEKPDIQRVKEAARLTNISPWIESLPLGYDTRIGADGVGLSSGQRQRIILARAIYRDNAFLFLDEATNALDADNEKVVMENLRQVFQGRTVLIVAHRLSTVKHANNIVVLKEGKITEQGTHRQLVSKKGEYYKLVSNQLELGT